MSNSDEDEGPSAISMAVGQRLRAVRRARQFSLDDVERKSEGRWSASAVGAYERGFRNLSLPRLRELAQFYDVPISVLLGEPDDADQAIVGGTRVVVDLEALNRAEDAEPVIRYLRTIIVERGDFNGRMLSIRRDDIRALCAVLQSSESDLYETLRGWGALLSGGTEADR